MAEAGAQAGNWSSEFGAILQSILRHERTLAPCPKADIPDPGGRCGLALRHCTLTAYEVDEVAALRASAAGWDGIG